MRRREVGSHPRKLMVVGAGVFLATLFAFRLVLYAHQPHRCPPGIPETPSFPEHLEQESIVSGAMSLQQILDAGERLFTTHFNRCDGQGRPAATGNGIPTKRVRGSAPDFARNSAPDSSSCVGCHNEPRAGGSGDFVANVFVLAQLRDPVPRSIAPAFNNERKTLGMNGAGAIELLAREMTVDLQRIRAEALAKAQRLAVPATLSLDSKGINFGQITALPTGEFDSRAVVGVDIDLVIRPFHQSGGVVSLREFTVNAMNHHHGMQAVERFGRARTGTDDFDEDGVADELTLGDITAVTIWQAALNIPGQRISPLKELDVQRGEKLFSRIGCAGCHVPTLALDSATFCEPNPFNPPGTFRDTRRSFCFDLCQEGKGPRLEGANGRGALVRAFTDLKRHRICDQQDAHFCNEQHLPPGGRLSTAEFLTRKLWDVGTSSSYGHRGDLTTITEAILAHGADGRPAKQAFVELTVQEQAQVIEFLKSLQVLPEGSPRVVRGK